MPSNKIQSLPSGDLADLVNRILTGIGTANPNPYGVSSADRAALQSALGALASSIGAASAAKDAYRAAVQDRNAKDAGCADAAARVINGIYANAAVTPAMIASLGLSPRSTSRARIVPQTPTDLSWALQPAGTILLRWSRNGNPQGVVFRIEQRTSAGDWTMVDETTSARIAMAGYEVGEPVAFRVVASKNGRLAPPTALLAVFGTAAPAIPTLRLAA